MVPLVFALTAGWLFVCLWSALAVFVFAHNAYWALILSGSTTTFAAFLLWLTVTTVVESFTNYTFELTNSEAVLTTYNRLRKRTKIWMMLLDDITFAEYYPYRDSSCLIFHAPSGEMEVPLWPMGARSEDILDYLRGRGIKIINVQSDECFPD
jgi:hypothetical protein